jgi:hypothetical protein
MMVLGTRQEKDPTSSIFVLRMFWTNMRRSATMDTIKYNRAGLQRSLNLRGRAMFFLFFVSWL